MTTRDINETVPTRSPMDVLRVGEVMHAGVITCPPDAPLRSVAETMAEQRVHCIVVESEDAGALWGVISDLDLVSAACTGQVDTWTAEGAAATPLVTVAPDETLARAGQLMTENSTAHLVVLDPLTAKPVGVVSTLDLVRAVGETEPA